MEKHSNLKKWSFEELDTYHNTILEVLKSAQNDRNLLDEYCKTLNKLFLTINKARNERAYQISEARELMEKMATPYMILEQRKDEFKHFKKSFKEKLKSDK